MHCPACNSTSTKKNGHIHNGKQNHYCKECSRQFVFNPQQILISLAKRQRIRKLLLERIPLRGICRVEGVSLRWLLAFIVDLYEQLPYDLNFQLKGEADGLLIYTLKSEVDEMFSFVGKKENKQWVWLAMDVSSRQIIAFHVGSRSRVSALALWESIPESYRRHATFYTDGWQAYEGVIPQKQHRVVKKQKRITNHIERFNCTLRQRVSRLVRKSLSFSKKLANHIGAIKYFICHYNLEKALHV
ncbi:IS1 family transposase [Candidatus Poribacteria bacterium]|nr:IS1 family transposase [Candidatus Poribacteria bacterium]